MYRYHTRIDPKQAVALATISNRSRQPRKKATNCKVLAECIQYAQPTSFHPLDGSRFDAHRLSLGGVTCSSPLVSPAPSRPYSSILRVHVLNPLSPHSLPVVPTILTANHMNWLPSSGSLSNGISQSLSRTFSSNLLSPFLGSRPDQRSGPTSTHSSAPEGVSITIPEGQIWRCINRSLDASGSRVLVGPTVFQPEYTGRSDSAGGAGEVEWKIEITTVSEPLYVSPPIGRVADTLLGNTQHERRAAKAILRRGALCRRDDSADGRAHESVAGWSGGVELEHTASSKDRGTSNHRGMGEYLQERERLSGG